MRDYRLNNSVLSSLRINTPKSLELTKIILISGFKCSPLKKSLSSLNHSNGDQGLSGNSIELIVHIKKEGFIIYVNSHFCTFFAHRRDPEFYSSLRFTLPARDDNGNPEEAVYHKVWWGINDPTLPTHEIPASVLALASMYALLTIIFLLHSNLLYLFCIILILFSPTVFFSFESIHISV